MQAFYQQQIGMDPDIQVIVSNSVDVTTIPGPVYIDGNGGSVTLTCSNADYTLPDTCDNRLIYVNGSVVFDKCNIYLNSYTLFASSTDYNLAVKVSNDSDVTGPGAIIAVGGIDFQPKLVSSQYIYLMSTKGKIRLAPMNDFVGAVAGKEVLVQSGDPKKTPSITWADPSEFDLNLPADEVHGLLLVGLVSWIIDPKTN